MASYEELGPNKKGLPGIKITVEHGYNELTGERIRFFKTVRMKKISERSIKKAITEFEIEVANKEKTKSIRIENITFSQFVTRWMDNYVKVDLAIGSRDAYNNRLNDGVLDALGKLKMARIKAYDIVVFFKEQKEKKASNLVGKYNVLKSVFAKAVEWQIIKENPMKNVRSPQVKKEKREIQFYNKEQLEHLLDVLKNVRPKDRIQIKLAALGGLRMSEIAGIRLECLDFNNCTILIDRTLKYDKETKKIFLGDTKSKRSRIVNIPKKFMKEIKEYAEQQIKLKDASGSAWNPLLDENEKPINLLFTKSNGFPTHPDRLTTIWGGIVKKYNLPSLNLHGLRHTYASYMISKGANPQVVQVQLGHSDIKLIFKTYSHLTDADKENVSDLLNELL
ncbi:site-specific integrase [Neobacillus sp. MM2021_6]|uniref:tyrosine-type recombinase/integrase n=1 Tax=Bacillaceae TaxID=186817 RepID=UPI00140AA032|nr:MULTISPECIES: site-specific integrase [Bacillaceae]MBO0961963.1 site-specific integrase [Neobacillus sp. MM2021_6]NHC20340.1 site-specific integrase [Bacillus sp. MM2020_4]